LWDITFKAKKGDGSRMNVGLDLTDIGASPVIKYIDVTTIQNGTFTTKDEVAPAINIAMHSSVSSTFNIVGTITEAGGMVGGQSSARATLKNQTYEESFDLLPLGGAAPDYTFSKQVTWPVFETITLIVDATDAAGNDAETKTEILNVVNAGFSNPEPADGSYINATPDYVRAFMTGINAESVQMYLGNAFYGPIDLNPDTSTGYAKNTTPINGLADGEYWVNVSGTDTFNNPRSLNWTFTLDTTAPVINTFTVADSDGDGYTEAGETLTLNWNVAADPSFDYVALVDAATGEEFWSSDSLSGTDTTSILDGNRDLAFRAYDDARNSDSRGFHLYYDYMIWTNSTRMGEISGIDTTYTAVKDISRTAVSSITLYGCTVTLPTLNQLERTVTNVGQVTSDTYVTVDMNANRTLAGSETYQNTCVMDPNVALDFLVQVPHAHKSVLVLAEANESYIAELIAGGRGGMHSVNYTELITRTAYIFIEGGWAQFTVDDDGTIIPGPHSGVNVTNAGSISATLRHPANQVDLHTGYRLSTQGLNTISLASGDYALAAIAMDGDRMGLLGAMPVMVMESDDQGAITPTSVQQNATFTAQFRYDTPCERLGVVVLRNVAYNGTALMDAATLGRNSLHLNLTYNGVPATQKLIDDIYVSPSSGKYVVANTNQATVSTSGLDAGTYRVYMVGQSANGTVQAYGEHTLQITSPTPSPTPTSAPYHGGSGGSGSNAMDTYTGTGTLKVNSAGVVLKTVKLNAGDNVGSLLVPIGVTALDADSKPLSSISLRPLATDEAPAVPTGAVFQFAGYAYEVTPAGATFSPEITLTMEIPDDVWETLDPNNQQFTVKWYNPESDLWEEIQTTISPGTRTVTATVTHFSTYALFTEPGTMPVTPTETATTVPTTTTTTTTPAGEPPAEGLPMTMIIFAIVIIAIIAVAGYYFFVMKK